MNIKNTLILFAAIACFLFAACSSKPKDHVVQGLNALVHSVPGDKILEIRDTSGNRQDAALATVQTTNSKGETVTIDVELRGWHESSKPKMASEIIVDENSKSFMQAMQDEQIRTYKSLRLQALSSK